MRMVIMAEKVEVHHDKVPVNRRPQLREISIRLPGGGRFIVTSETGMTIARDDWNYLAEFDSFGEAVPKRHGATKCPNCDFRIVVRDAGYSWEWHRLWCNLATYYGPLSALINLIHDPRVF